MLEALQQMNLLLGPIPYLVAVLAFAFDADDAVAVNAVATLPEINGQLVPVGASLLGFLIWAGRAVTHGRQHMTCDMRKRQIGRPALNARADDTYKWPENNGVRCAAGRVDRTD